MRADELRTAVVKIAEILDRADVRTAVDQFRAARGNDRTVAAARLGHAGAIVKERFEQLTEDERTVVNHLHLGSLASAKYWNQLLATAGTPGPGNVEIVRLASRVMFASNHLPGLAALLDNTSSAEVAALEASEGRLVARLADAGESATDPDRIARSIDGIDMLYSACASISTKPAMDLRLDAIDGADTRDLHYTGEKDAIAAVTAVLDSIPETLAEIDESSTDIDLDEIVASLPVFSDLQTLASLGTFTDSDLKEITETMYQGAMLVLESGVTLVPVAAPRRSLPQAPVAAAAAGAQSHSDLSPTALTQGSASETPAVVGQLGSGSATDHYDQYLRAREAMQQSSSNDAAQRLAMPESTDLPLSAGTDKAERHDSVEELLDALSKVKRKG